MYIMCRDMTLAHQEGSPIIWATQWITPQYRATMTTHAPRQTHISWNPTMSIGLVHRVSTWFAGVLHSSNYMGRISLANDWSIAISEEAYSSPSRRPRYLMMLNALCRVHFRMLPDTSESALCIHTSPRIFMKYPCPFACNIFDFQTYIHNEMQYVLIKTIWFMKLIC